MVTSQNFNFIITYESIDRNLINYTVYSGNGHGEEIAKGRFTIFYRFLLQVLLDR